MGLLPLLLGSASPRRAEILSFFSLPFEQKASFFDEEKIAFLGDPVGYAKELSIEKGKLLFSLYPDRLILTADSVVYCEGKIYNKPSSLEEAREFLKNFSGKWQEVTTAVSLMYKGEIETSSATTKILFKNLTPQQIEQITPSLHPLDKAGGYGIEKSGALLVEKLEGCYYNVLGLPIQVVANLLAKKGINLWEYLGS